MISAINPLNTNNKYNAKNSNNVNFKGYGEIYAKTPYALTPNLKGAILDLVASVGEDAPHPELGSFLAKHLRMPFETAFPHIGHNVSFEEGFAELCRTTIPIGKLAKSGKIGAAQYVRTWLNETNPSEFRKFGEELEEYLRYFKVIDDENKFIGVPLREIHITDGNNIIPDNYLGMATDVIWHGGQLNNPRFQNVKLYDINHAGMPIDASGSVLLSTSSVGDLTALREVYMNGSTADDVIANEIFVI